VRYFRGTEQLLMTNAITMIDSKIEVQISRFISGVLILLIASTFH
jgi:hypothetical protein